MLLTSAVNRSGMTGRWMAPMRSMACPRIGSYAARKSTSSRPYRKNSMLSGFPAPCQDRLGMDGVVAVGIQPQPAAEFGVRGKVFLRDALEITDQLPVDACSL